MPGRMAPGRVDMYPWYRHHLRYTDRRGWAPSGRSGWVCPGISGVRLTLEWVERAATTRRLTISIVAGEIGFGRLAERRTRWIESRPVAHAHVAIRRAVRMSPARCATASKASTRSRRDGKRSERFGRLAGECRFGAMAQASQVSARRRSCMTSAARQRTPRSRRAEDLDAEQQGPPRTVPDAHAVSTGDRHAAAIGRIGDAPRPGGGAAAPPLAASHTRAHRQRWRSPGGCHRAHMRTPHATRAVRRTAGPFDLDAKP